MQGVEEIKKYGLSGPVGFDSITKQIERKLIKQGFTLNLMLVGRSGLGKSTLINTLFSAHLLDLDPISSADLDRPTVEISSSTHLVEENKIRLRVTITDTPGYGDQINNDHCWDPIVRHVKEQHAIFLRKELTPMRERHAPDTRIHAVLFFVNPNGHSLSPLDITVMKKVSEVCNVIPIIGKADTLTIDECAALKKRIMSDIEAFNIRIFPFLEHPLEHYPEGERKELYDFLSVRDRMPFAVVGSEKNVVVDGKAVRGRRTKWGIINVENEKHCEFIGLRKFLMTTHLQDLIETTNLIHYETFRTRQLLALKESAGAQRSAVPHA